jgi:uncharacterized damage-inducible protein DinB
MALKDSLLPEFDHEMAVTRRVLERVPLQDAAWQPHSRSMSLGALATHLAEIPTWVPTLLHHDGYDMGAHDDTSGSGPSSKFQETDLLLAEFDKNVKAARELIAGTSDAQFMEPWTLKDKGQELFTMPKIGTLRAWLFSHSIHHRGQMTVYLRLRDVPIPAIYGPSADER